MSATSGEPEELTLDELMRQMGSKTGFDPIPPDQYLWFLNVGESHEQRVLAHVRLKCIRKKKCGRTLWARDERGDLKLTDIADDLDMHLQHVSAAWARLEDKGLVSRDEQGRLRLCGHVPMRRINNEGEETAITCTSYFPAYLYEQYQQLDEKQRAQFDHLYKGLAEWEEQVKADAMYEAREHINQVKREAYKPFGIELQDGTKNKWRDRTPIVQLNLITSFESFFSQNGNGHSTNGNNQSYNGQGNGSQNREQPPPHSSPAPLPLEERIEAIVQESGLEIHGHPLHPKTLRDGAQRLAGLTPQKIDIALDWLAHALRDIAKHNRARKWGILISLCEQAAEFARKQPVRAPVKPKREWPAYTSIAEEIEVNERFVAASPNHPDAQKARERIEELRKQSAPAVKMAGAS